MRAFVAVLIALSTLPVLRAEEPPPKPRLAVLIVFDQMRGDFLERWFELFGEGGFRRLLNDGAWFQNCHYPYAMTATGPGHASLLTGCSPRTHGIVGNNWFDPKTGSSVYCATASRYERIPPPPKESTEAKSNESSEKKDDLASEPKPRGFGAPANLLVATLGDALREQSPNSKIVGLSLKDRSAILPVGRKPDACYWFDKGEFVTSTYYRDRLHPWASEFNARKSCDQWFGKKWEKLRSDLDYAKHSSADDSPGEGTGSKQGRTFPHPFGAAEKIGKEYYDALATSPFGNQLLLDFAIQAIEGEQLGKDDAPDLLTISFSSNDSVGHAWGPDSQEVLDITLRSDAIIRDLLNYLDVHVGKGRYVIAMSADHGICSLPERSKAAGRRADRQHPLGLLTAAEAHLRMKYAEPANAKTRWIEAANESGIYLNQRMLNAHKLQPAEVAATLAAWLKEQPVIHDAFVRDELLKAPLSANRLIRRVQQSLHTERSGDVYFVVKPYHLITSYKTGTTHGTPHCYDTHVPLVVFGPGVKTGKRENAVTPQACAAILAKALGVRPPATAEAPLPDNLFEQ